MTTPDALTLFDALFDAGDTATNEPAPQPYDPRRSYVAATGWNISYRTGAGTPGAVLHVRRFIPQPGTAGGGATVAHPLYDGMEFSSRHSATAYAYKVGLTKRATTR